jgi:hypothetical protein
MRPSISQASLVLLYQLGDPFTITIFEGSQGTQVTNLDELEKAVEYLGRRGSWLARLEMGDPCKDYINFIYQSDYQDGA